MRSARLPSSASGSASQAATTFAAASPWASCASCSGDLISSTASAVRISRKQSSTSRPSGLRPEEVLPPEVLKQFPKQKLSREEQIAFAKALADPPAPNAKLL